jgi:mannitol-specific phosphotransferase system IIBC component
MRPSSAVLKMMKATKRKMLSKATKAKQPLILANLKLLPALTQGNPNFVMGKPMLTIDALHKAGQPCVNLHNYYINNYKSSQDVIVSYKDRHFQVGDNVFVISFSDVYDFFNLDALDVSLMRYFAL